jgi:hypothetical protein
MNAFAATITRALAPTPCVVDAFCSETDTHCVAFVDVAPAMVAATLATLTATFAGATCDGDVVTTGAGFRIYVQGA